MKIVLFITLSIFSLSLFAQTQPDTVKYWNNEINPSLNINQVSLTNWSAGGENSFSGTAYLKAILKYKKNKTAWDNLIDIGYGMSKQGDGNLYKTEDKLNLASKIGIESGESNWYYTGMLDFKTIMSVGYNDPANRTGKLSEFMAPGFLNASIGMDYKPSDNFSIYLSPVSSKMTFVLDDSLSTAGAFGVDPGSKFRSEYGAKVSILAKKENLLKNISVGTRLDLFSNLTHNPQNIDVYWEFITTFKVNDWLSAVFSLNIIYDDDIKYVDTDGTVRGARTQVKQLFGFGLNYKMHN